MRCSVAGHSPLRELRKHVGRLAVACTPLMQRDVLQASNPMVRSKVWIHAWIGWLGAVYMLHLALYMLHLAVYNVASSMLQTRATAWIDGVNSQRSLVVVSPVSMQK
jgi:hypothetical protein